MIGTISAHHSSAFTLGGTGGGIAYNQRRIREIAERGLNLSPVSRSAHRRIARRLEGIRDGSHARPNGQLRRHLLHRELRSDGRAHRRFHHRRAHPNADRSRNIRRMRDACVRGDPRDWRRNRRSNIQFAVHPENGRMVVIEMNPRVSAAQCAGVQSDGLSHREDRGQARGRLYARRTQERHHPRNARQLRANASITAW